MTEKNISALHITVISTSGHESNFTLRPDDGYSKDDYISLIKELNDTDNGIISFTDQEGISHTFVYLNVFEIQIVVEYH